MVLRSAVFGARNLLPPDDEGGFLLFAAHRRNNQVRWVASGHPRMQVDSGSWDAGPIPL